MAVAQLSSIERREQSSAAWSTGWTDFAILTFFSLIIFFFRLGSISLIDPSDSYYAEGAREMIENHDYLFPTINYQLYFGKPILMFWLIAFAFHVFGTNEFAARFWSAASATAVVLIAYWTGRSLSNRMTGLMAGLICVSTPIVVKYAHLAYIDMTFSSLLGIAIFALVITLCTNSRKWWPVFYICLALSVLTKGPGGLAFVIAGLVIYLAIKGFSPDLIGRMIATMHPIPGVAVFFLIVTPWYLAISLATSGLWPKAFFLYENYGMFCGLTNIAKTSWWYYVAVVTYLFFPWIIYLPAAIRAGFMPRLRACSSEVQLNKTAELDRRRQGAYLLASFVLAVFFVLSVAKRQLLYYILPAMAPAAVLTAIEIELLIERYQGMKTLPLWLRSTSWFLAVFGVVGTLTILSILQAIKFLPLWIMLFIILGSMILAGGLMLQLVLLNMGRVREKFLCLGLTSAAVAACFCPVAFELWYRNGQSELQRIVQAVSKVDGRVAVYKSDNFTPVFYLKRPVDFIAAPEMLVTSQEKDLGYTPHQYVIAPAIYAQHLTNRFPSKTRLLINEPHWKLYEAIDLHAQRYPALEDVYKIGLASLIADRDKFGPLVLPLSGGRFFHGKRENGNLGRN